MNNERYKGLLLKQHRALKGSDFVICHGLIRGAELQPKTQHFSLNTVAVTEGGKLQVYLLNVKGTNGQQPCKKINK